MQETGDVSVAVGSTVSSYEAIIFKLEAFLVSQQPKRKKLKELRYDLF